VQKDSLGGFGLWADLEMPKTYHAIKQSNERKTSQRKF